MSPQGKPLIRMRGLGKRFAKDGQAIVAIDSIDLDVPEGTFMTVAGPSGCGKSTMLNVVAGLQPPTSGTVYVKDQPVKGPTTDIGYLTQKDTLMPWRDLESNVAMPLEIQGMAKRPRRERSRELLRLVGLDGFERHYPSELSGGMLRRACLARMLSSDPEVFLMDEPFGALDAQLRLQLQGELLRLWSGSGKTIVFVTHDIEEAIALGDRVVVLGRPGHVVHEEPVELARPRDPATVRFRDEYREIHERLWQFLVAGASPQREAEQLA